MGDGGDKCPFCPCRDRPSCWARNNGLCDSIRGELMAMAGGAARGSPMFMMAAGQCGRRAVSPSESEVSAASGAAPDPAPARDPGPAARPPADDPPLPPLWKMAAGFIRDSAVHIINGMPKRPQEEYDRIMAICRSCDHLRSDGRCGKQTGCGCGMNVKASWGLTKCPVGKW